MNPSPFEFGLKPTVPRDQACVLYGRLSRGDQSLDAMNRRMVKYATVQRELTIIASLEDDDTTGDTEKISIANRPGGGQVLAYLNTGKVGHIVITTTSRIARRAEGFLAFYRYLKERQITLHIADCGGDSFSLSGFIGKMFLTQLALFDEWELETIRDRTTKRLTDKRGNSELVGSVPYGWDALYRFADGHEHRSAKALFWGGKRGKGSTEKENQAAEPEAQDLINAHGLPTHRLLVDHPAEQAVLRQIAAWRQDRHTLKYIAEWLNTTGHRTKLGGHWHTSNVESVLNNQHTKRLLAQTSAVAEEQAA